MALRTETETVIKKILPYLERRGYDVIKDLDFETPLTLTDSYSKGFVDVLVTLGKKTPFFLIEAKRITKRLTEKDRDQAIKYAKSKDINVLFVVVTNGIDIQCYNVKNKQRILWDGKDLQKIPSKEQVLNVVKILKANPDTTNISISNDNSLPYRQGLPLRQLNALFYKGHSSIRKIEKDEESAFSDFSKLLFLRLLEEKNDTDLDFSLPYSYTFYELADTPMKNADRVKTAINSMISEIVNNTPYGEVLSEPIKMKNPKTYLSLVKDLSSVSFFDCSYDSKGAAFEYYVRATLKGKKLGQYFTPREVVRVMIALVGENKILNSVLTNIKIKVLDPACGTGGFLVYLMQDTLKKLKAKLDKREINMDTYKEAVRKIKSEVFYGSDANAGVAASAKMNMIIAGDGHTNIINEDSLSINSRNWNTTQPDCTMILTNPPFGTSESESQTDADLNQFDIRSSKGQYLFIQKMIKSTTADGEICTVIDEGVLNTETGTELREYILKNCKIRAIVSLPSETFKPNKINVRSSIIYMQKRGVVDELLEDKYEIAFCQINSLGYTGAGDKIRGFNSEKFYQEISNNILDLDGTIKSKVGYYWNASYVSSEKIIADSSHRFDYKYWANETQDKIKELIKNGSPSIKQLNRLNTSRGKSPSTDCYVDEADGYAVVIKAGSCITKLGTINIEDADWIEKSLYEEYVENEKNEKIAIEKKIREGYKKEKGDDWDEKTCEEDILKILSGLKWSTNIINYGDVLLASTGDGTLGKCCVYNIKKPAIADGHVTIIRVNPNEIDPYYLSDYLRKGFGATEINRLYTGSTGLIELTPDQVNSILVDMRSSVSEQVQLSKSIRKLEKEYSKKLELAEQALNKASKILI